MDPVNGHFSPINGLESVNGIQFSLCGTPTNLIFAHRDIFVCVITNLRVVNQNVPNFGWSQKGWKSTSNSIHDKQNTYVHNHSIIFMTYFGSLLKSRYIALKIATNFISNPPLLFKKIKPFYFRQCSIILL